jgi:hypothetical protein
MIVSPEVIVEAAGPLGDAPSRPIKAFYNLCGYDPSEESPILLSWIGDFFLSGGLPKMATCSESKQFTVCIFSVHNRKASRPGEWTAGEKWGRLFVGKSMSVFPDEDMIPQIRGKSMKRG